jgi:hypothetical protein
LEQLDGVACVREGFPGFIELAYEPVDGAAVLRCSVNAEPASLSADPTQLVLVSGGPAQTVTISNNGELSSGALTVSLVQGGPSGSFEIVSDGCTGQALAGAGTCTVQVRVFGVGIGVRLGTLTVTGTPGGSASVQLQGNPDIS